MSRIAIQGNGYGTAEEKGKKSIGAFRFAFINQGENVPNSQTVQVTCKLFRAGVTYTIFSGPLYALAVADSPGSRDNLAVPGGYGFVINLPQAINLKDDDYMTYTMSVAGNAVDGTTIMSSEYTVQEGLYVPRIDIIPINKTQENQSNIPIGNNVSRIVIVSASTAVQLTTFSIASDKWSCDFGSGEFVSALADSWIRAVDRWAFPVYPDPRQSENSAGHGFPIDGATMSYDSITSEAVNGWIVVYNGDVTQVTRRRSTEMVAKHTLENKSKFFASN